MVLGLFIVRKNYQTTQQRDWRSKLLLQRKLLFYEKSMCFMQGKRIATKHYKRQGNLVKGISSCKAVSEGTPKKQVVIWVMRR